MLRPNYVRAVTFRAYQGDKELLSLSSQANVPITYPISVAGIQHIDGVPIIAFLNQYIIHLY